MLRYMIIFFTLLMQALNVRAQCEMPPVGENKIMIDIPDQQTFPEGSTVKFKCSTGYIPVRSTASRSITCNGNQWSKLQLQCKKKSCGNPGEVLNGKYLFSEGILYGATITAQCNEGYLLVGHSTRNCRESGWDERSPVCEVVKCLPPPSIIDGEFEPVEESYAYGEGVLYSCKRGLDLFGSSLVTCSNNGNFQPAPPRCLSVTCEKPEIQKAFRIEGKSPPYKYRDFVRLQCIKGYKMDGSDTLICTEDGWDPPSTQCTIVTCFPPRGISNGQFYPQEEIYEYEDTVTYTCNEGFRLRGFPRKSCTEHGTFQPSPECQEITCDPRAIRNVIVERSSLYKYNTSIKITCEKGYKTVGSDQLTCGETGWRPNSTPCTVVTCSPPLVISNGQFRPQKMLYKYEDRVTYTCTEGYRIKASATISCTEHGTFQPSPECQIVTCFPPRGISNGQFYPQEEIYEYGDTVTYTCNEGYRIKASATISCTEHGTFQRSPWCQEITCDPRAIRNVIVERSSLYKYNTSIKITCEKGYKTVGSDQLTCGENGWRPNSTPCTVVTCFPPRGIRNGQFYPQEEIYEYEDTVTYTCNEGYRIKASATISCTEHGTFQRSPWCQEITCDPRAIRNVIVERSSLYKYNTSIKITCEKGYKTVGSDQLTCGENGWRPNSTPCTVVTCFPPRGIRNGQFYPQEEIYEYEDTVTYTCNEGYRIKASATISCTEHGTFQRSPWCQEITCDPRAIRNVIVERSSLYKYNTSIKITCEKGYKTVGSDQLTCGENGWRPNSTPCTVVTCFPPRGIRNGQFYPQEEIYEYEDTVTYTCNEGYRIKASATISCTEHGTFQRSPWCQEITCDPRAIRNVIVERSSLYKYNTSIKITCEKGYKTVGSDQLTCGENGWRPNSTPCTVVTCFPPRGISNGQFYPQEEIYEYEDTVTYTCTEGYRIKASATISCTEHGTFQPSPECQAQCDAPSVGENRILTEDSGQATYPEGTTLTYKCSTGYLPVQAGSSRSITCTGKQWTELQLQCQLKSCGSLGELANGKYLTPDGIKFGATATAQCNKGYMVVGEKTRTCQDDGWDGRDPVCEAQCDAPSVGENRILTEDSGQATYPEGTTLTYKCSTGYLPVQAGSSRSITCTGKQWTELQLQCQLKSCGSLGELANGKYLTPDGIKFGATATAQCNKGYMVVGVKTRNCRDDGWDGRDPVCEAAKCQTPSDIQNGMFEPLKDVYDYGEAVIYSCNKDYTLVGDSEMVCPDNGTFPPPPRCLKISCDGFMVENAQRIEGRAPPYKYLEFVRYKCNEGFRMEGSAFLKCEVNGWSSPPPKCIDTTVPIPPGPIPPGPVPTTSAPPVPNGNTTVIWIVIGVLLALILVGGLVFYLTKRA
ncbi:sushi, von Willebrand factor type A, EGF and pentraxin domain-containing protein 1-like isoform X2 [Hemibagrus wyckioides]|uniref:sushi, von Willebrand factor type A, EGF and pentraxin domain-containing protein 1-like isoform X2 n=1 Tax=Hemibagrus wyckioides TaxID=337641 RepID=UPI00266BFF8E|nr:sushi, von Willebrand factor type A, EGF and pentraxin domain-containing protein 1-like isoform X2 [Hemibagrus wyckioides]